MSEYYCGWWLKPTNADCVKCEPCGTQCKGTWLSRPKHSVDGLGKKLADKIKAECVPVKLQTLRDKCAELDGMVNEYQQTLMPALRNKLKAAEQRCSIMSNEIKNQVAAREQAEQANKAKDERIKVLEDELKIAAKEITDCHDGDLCPLERFDACPKTQTDLSKCPLEGEGFSPAITDVYECWKLRWLSMATFDEAAKAILDREKALGGGR